MCSERMKALSRLSSSLFGVACSRSPTKRFKASHLPPRRLKIRQRVQIFRVVGKGFGSSAKELIDADIGSSSLRYENKTLLSLVVDTILASTSVEILFHQILSTIPNQFS